jgi:hypothetical protein
MTPLTSDEITDLRVIAEKATPGPYEVHNEGEFMIRSREDDVAACLNKDNAVWIMRATNTLLRALDTIEAQEETIEKAGEIARALRDCLREANEKIEAQVAMNGRLREILRPFAEVANTISRDSGIPDAQISNDVWVSVRLGVCRAVRDAIEKGKDQ